MKQPIKKINKKAKIQEKSIKKDSGAKAGHVVHVGDKTQRNNMKYGTSKLEKYFAKEFLDKHGVHYIYEFEAKDIKRFYDFAIVTKKSEYVTEEKEGLTSIVQGIQHTPIDCLIEIDGGYWHSDPRLFDESKLNAIQKRNKRVDTIKDKWASMHGIPLIRIWEYDIRHNPKNVMDELKKYIHIHEEKKKKGKRVMKLK